MNAKQRRTEQRKLNPDIRVKFEPQTQPVFVDTYKWRPDRIIVSPAFMDELRLWSTERMGNA